MYVQWNVVYALATHDNGLHALVYRDIHELDYGMAEVKSMRAKILHFGLKFCNLALF